jgi:DNA-directed RNA polymerase specialized sigma24 family protein
VLRYWHDMSEADIAATLGWPRGTVKSTLSRALKRLRKDIER